MTDLVIRNGRVEPDLWRLVSAEEAIGPLPAGPIVVPPAAWKARREALAARLEPLGVWLEPHEDPAQIAGDLDRFALVALHFPKFTDGRNYSSAVLLRTRYGWRGELRAFGDVGRDQLFYLKRCGFTCFKLPPHRDPHAALESLEPFSVRYQGSVDDPLPLFRKRAGARGEASHG